MPFKTKPFCEVTERAWMFYAPSQYTSAFVNAQSGYVEADNIDILQTILGNLRNFFLLYGLYVNQNRH